MMSVDARRIRGSSIPAGEKRSEEARSGAAERAATRVAKRDQPMKLTIHWALVAALALTQGLAGARAEDGAAPAPAAVSTNPNNIAPTVADAPHRNVEIFGKPRVAVGHPNTMWDAEDIRDLKEMAKTSPGFRQALSDLQKTMDERIGKPIDVPAPQRGPDGAWLYPGDYFPDFPGRPHTDNPVLNFSRFLAQDSTAIASLGILYALTDEEKYAKYARDLLLAYSNLPRYGPSKQINYRFAHGLTNQILEDALDLETIARGYDLVYNSPALSPADRKRIHDELIQPLAWVLLYPEAQERDPSSNFIRQPNNRGSIGAAAVLLAGYATDDQELVNAALYGTVTTLTKNDKPRYTEFPPPKDWVAATAEHPSNGLLTVHFASQDITGGLWVEGTPAYALYALNALINAAEAGWRHGLDLYGYNNSILKYVFDGLLLAAYPDLSTPAENDSHRAWLRRGQNRTLYEYAYRRYRDPRYLAVINPDRTLGPGRDELAKDRRDLVSARQPDAPPPLSYDPDPHQEAPRLSFPRVNFPTVGFGVLRAPAASGSGLASLTLSYGPSASHGHPDKLHIDLWALDDILMPSPGVQFPYNLPVDVKWHWTTLSHNTLTVDEQSQHFFAHPVQKEQARADQSVYGPAETLGVERAWSDSVYPGIKLDRAVCLTGDYLADLFAASSDAPHRYDLAWHIRGGPSSDLPFAVSPFPDPVPNGYNAFTEVRQAPQTNGSWSVAFDEGARIARLTAVGGAPTQPILGLGGVFADTLPSEKQLTPTVPTIIERRDGAPSTLFGNVLDFSGGKDGFVKTLTQDGGLDQGFALLRIATADGGDFCAASYRPGVHSAAGLETDALQALVRMKGRSPAALYLGGGTVLKVGDTALRRSEEGLAYVEQTPDGAYVLANPSPSAATVTVSLKALQGLKAFALGGDGKPTGKADVSIEANGAISARLEAGARIGFFPPGKP